MSKESKKNAEEKKLQKKNEKESKELIVKKEKKHNERKGRWLRQTSLTVLLIAIIVAACIGLNLFIDNQNIAEFDFTKDKVYSLSEMSKNITEGIDQEVEIILVNMAEAQIDFAKKYNSVNDNLIV